MTAHQHGVVMGLLYSLPVATWTVAQGMVEWHQEGSVHLSMQAAIKVLWFAQIIATSLLISGALVRYSRRQQFAGAMAAILLPLPLLPLAWLTGTVTGTVLVHGQIVVAVFCLLMLVAVNGVRQLPLATRLCASAHVGIQVLGVALLWRFRDTWLGWIGV